MDRATILEKIIALVCDTLDAEAADVTEGTTFDDLNADSFDKLELVTALEDEFGLTLDDDVLASIGSVHDAVDAIAAAQ